MPFLKESRFLALSAANFFSRYHFYLVIFVISSFLASFIGSSQAEFAIAGANAVSVLVLAIAPALFGRFRTHRVLAIFGMVEIAVLVALTLVESASLAVILLVIMTSVTFTIFLGLDVLVEAITTDESKTGEVRGVFLTVSNISTLIATLTLAAILVGPNYGDAFLVAALVLVPFIMLAWGSFPHASHIKPSERISIRSAVQSMFRIPPVLRPILGTHFLLQLGYAWMNFYVTLYLFTYVGFSWHTISLILALSMIPYLILEMPLGWLADRWLGERRILIAGFGIIGIATAAGTFVGTSVAAWMALVIVMNIGFAAVEIMSESAFFMRVTDGDGGTMSLLRILRPLASIAGPSIAGLLLIVLSPEYLFIVFGAVLVLGILIAQHVTDFRTPSSVAVPVEKH